MTIDTSSRAATGAWRTPLAGGLRKQPLQERSRSTVQRILAVAEELVEEVGFEAVVGSPTLLLDRSGVSRGSFYAFFETPERVLDELSYQQILRSVTQLDEALRKRPGRDWAEILEVLVDFYVMEHRMPLIRELWVRQNLTRKARDMDQLAIGDLAGLLLREFRRHAPLFHALTELQCVVAMHTVERVCQFAFTDNPHGDPRSLAELRRLLHAYFAEYAQERRP